MKVRDKIIALVLWVWAALVGWHFGTLPYVACYAAGVLSVYVALKVYIWYMKREES